MVEASVNGPITRSEKSYRVCVCVGLILCYIETSKRGSLGPILAVALQRKELLQAMHDGALCYASCMALAATQLNILHHYHGL
jgi:hypothetical protein